MRIPRLLAAALAVTVLAVLAPAPAWAHNSLTGAEPAKNATLNRAPGGVELTFLQKVDPVTLTIAVTDAGQRTVPAGPPRPEGRTGTIEFTEPPANGVYTVTYRVVSLDGHPVQGSYRFTVADPTASAAPSPAPSATTESPAPAGSAAPEAMTEAGTDVATPGAYGWWPAVATVAAAALLAVVAVLMVRRRRTP